MAVPHTENREVDTSAIPPETQNSEPKTQNSTSPEARRPTPVRAWAFRVAGTLLFVAILVFLDVRGTLPLDKLASTLLGANLALVGFSIALYVPFIWVKAGRWRAVCADMQMPMKWGDAWRIYAIGLAAGTFTPGQA